MTPTAESKPDPAEIAAGLTGGRLRAFHHCAMGYSWTPGYTRTDALTLVRVGILTARGWHPTPLGRAVAAHLEANDGSK